MLTVLCAAAVHELGHWAVLRAWGARVTGFRVGILGAVLETDSARLSYGRELAAVLAGPGANLLAGLALLGTGGHFSDVGAHWMLCAFNLLPIRPLDGGRALYLAVAWGAGPEAGERAARWLGAAASLALAGGLFWLMKCSGGSLWLLPAAAALLGTALLELTGRQTGG